MYFHTLFHPHIFPKNTKKKKKIQTTLLEQCYQMGPKYQESYKRELHC